MSVAQRGDRDGRPLVLLPGPTDSWRSYTEVLDRLPDELHAIAVSQRGHGDSDKPAVGYQLDDFAADVVALLDALDLEKATLVGHSGSCFVTRHVALQHPDRVAGLVLEASPTTLRHNPRLTEFVSSVIANLDDPIDPDFVRSFIADTATESIESGFLEMLIDEAQKVPAHVWREVFAAVVAYDDVAGLPEIGVPTLLVWGTADALVDRAMQDELVRGLADARLVAYDGLGHTPRWEVPARFAADVAAFTAGTV